MLTDLDGATISSITLYPSYSLTVNNASVFLKEVENSTISTSFTGETGVQVFSGTLTLATTGMVITFTEGYEYNGGNLLVGIYKDYGGSYPTGSFSGQTTTTMQAFYSYDWNASSWSEITTGTQYAFIPKTTFTYEPAQEGDCDKPETLVAEALSSETATLNWGGGSGTYNVEIKGGSYTDWSLLLSNTTDMTTMVENLTPNTAYQVRVQSVCTGETPTSGYKTADFTTPMCDDMCSITLELTDSYGDGWSGNAIKVVNAVTGEVLGQFTNLNLNGTTGSGTNELNTHILPICHGLNIRFEWVSGSGNTYPSECSWVVKDFNGEEIFSGSNATGYTTGQILATWTSSCAVPDCPNSTNLNAQVTGDQAELSWTSTATAWQVCLNGDEDNLIDITENPYTLESLTLSTNYTVKVRANCTATGDGYGDWSNTVEFTTNPCTFSEMCEINYEFTMGSWSSWYGAAIKVIDVATSNVLATWTGGESGSLPLCPGQQIRFEWQSGNYDTWEGVIGSYTITDFMGEVILSGSGSPLAASVIHTVSCTMPTCLKPTMNNMATNIEATSATVSWTAGGTNQDHWDVYYGTTNTAPTASTVPQIAYTTDNPCTLTGLSASTTYYVWVRGNCGTEEEPDYSDWSSAYCVFTTMAYCLDMLVYNSSIVFADLTSESVTVNFEGAGAATEWKVQLSTASDFSANLHEKVVTTASASFDGLEANKTYFVRVAPYCDEADDYTPWSPNRYFKTYCGIVTIDETHQWEEGFEDYNVGTSTSSGADVTDIQCWERVQVSNSTPKVYRNYEAAASTGLASLELKSSSGNPAMIALPEFSAPIKDLSVAFNYNCTSTTNTYTAELGYISNVTDATSFVKLFDIPTPVGRGSYTSYSQDLYEAAAADNAPAGSRVAIKFVYNPSTYSPPSWNFDDFQVSYVMGCRKPVDLTYAEVKSTSVKLNWVKTDDAQTSWEVAYCDETATPAAYQVKPANTNVDFVLGGLNPETPYKVKVRTNCGTMEEPDYSDWSNEISFTTEAACMKPNTLAADNITAVSAEITWTGESENYNVKYRELTPSDETETTTEDFSSYTATSYNTAGSLPEGWVGFTSSTMYPICHVSNNSELGSSYALSGFGSGSTENFLYIIGGGNSPYNSYAILPQISDLEAVSFDYAYESANYGTFTVGYCTSNTSGSTFTAFNDLTLTETSTVTNVSLTAADIATINSNNGYLAFQWNCSSSYAVGIDNVVITTRAYTAGAWQETTNNIDHGIELNGLTAGTNYEVIVQSDCGGGIESEWSEVFTFTTLEDGTKVFVTEGDWNEGANWAPAGAPTLEDDVIIRANATIPADCVALADKITVEGTNTITIEDGGQLLHSTVAVYATMKKQVQPYEEAEGIDNYILLASPMQPTVFAEAVENLLPLWYENAPAAFNVDFYQFDNSQELEWVNLENSDEFQLVNGEGYLYAHNWGSPITLAFKDALMYSHEPKAIGLDYNSGNANWAGWNLIGNPFPCNATVSNAADPAATFNYYKINAAGEFVTADGTVAPMEGIFALATDAGQEATFTRVVPGENSIAPTDGILNVNLMSNEAATRKGNSRIDMARLRFGHGNKLGKLNLFRSNATVFFPQDGKDYSVMYADAQGEMPLHFKAEKNGTYTLGFTTEDVSFGYLHLIDNLTGTDVDLLATPSYTFDARTTDYASRFRLVFSANGTNGDDNFGFIDAAGNLVITDATAGATLQIIDVMGRVVVSRDASNASAISTSGMTAGVYMLRLINGTNVKVQKIVVK